MHTSQNKVQDALLPVLFVVWGSQEIKLLCLLTRNVSTCFGCVDPGMATTSMSISNVFIFVLSRKFLELFYLGSTL